MEFLKKFVELTRAYALLVTFASCFVMYSYAHYSPKFSFVNFLILVFALCCVHLGANLYDDYKDVKRQLIKGKSLEEVSFNGFIPKAALIRNKTFSINMVRYIIGTFFIFAIAIGICFIKISGWPVLIFMLAGGILSIIYPDSSRYNCAELIIGLIYGPLMIMGGYYALTSEFEPRLFLLSLAILFSTMTLLHTHSIMDWEFDMQDGKKTLAILTGSKQNAIKALTVIISIPYLIITVGVLLNLFNPKMLYVFLTLPVSTKLISSMKEYIEVKDVEFKPRWYWGFFENWKTIKEQNIDFFMFRFYLARNFAFFFALIAAIGAMR